MNPELLLILKTNRQAGFNIIQGAEPLWQLHQRFAGMVLRKRRPENISGGNI